MLGASRVCACLADNDAHSPAGSRGESPAGRAGRPLQAVWGCTRHRWGPCRACGESGSARPGGATPRQLWFCGTPPLGATGCGKRSSANNNLAPFQPTCAWFWPLCACFALACSLLAPASGCLLESPALGVWCFEILLVSWAATKQCKQLNRSCEMSVIGGCFGKKAGDSWLAS